MLIKVHESYRRVVAVCDKELLGKKFEEGKRQLDVRKSFYDGEDANEEKIVDQLKSFAQDDSMFNIVGERAVKVAFEAEVITEENIAEVDGVKFALLLL